MHDDQTLQGLQRTACQQEADELRQELAIAHARIEGLRRRACELVDALVECQRALHDQASKAWALEARNAELEKLLRERDEDRAYRDGRVRELEAERDEIHRQRVYLESAIIAAREGADMLALRVLGLERDRDSMRAELDGERSKVRELSRRLGAAEEERDGLRAVCDGAHSIAEGARRIALRPVGVECGVLPAGEVGS